MYLSVYNICIMKSLIVNEKFNSKKLNSFLMDNFSNLSINTLYKALRKKDIRINGKRVSKNVTIYAGDIVDVYISDELLLSTKTIDIPTVYEDDNILIVNKPTGIEITGENSLTSVLQNKYSSNISPCHRLDRNTTGLIVFSKNSEALDILLNKFKHHEIEKHYACLVYGTPNKETETLTAYLFKDAKKSMVYISNSPKKGYLKIITTYTILNQFNNNTCILDVNLHTGRTHQIRAHLAHIGHPIIGDGKYGINEINKKFNAKNQKLCSYKLKFNFVSESGILDYLKGKEFKIDYNF